MFIVDEENNVISLSKGDTGALWIAIDPDGYVFQPEDRAVFSIKDSRGNLVKSRAYEIEDNEFLVTFFNADTDQLTPGSYSWDVRVVLHPYYSETGEIIDGEQVITPNLPMQCSLLQVVGEI